MYKSVEEQVGMATQQKHFYFLIRLILGYIVFVKTWSTTAEAKIHAEEPGLCPILNALQRTLLVVIVVMSVQLTVIVIFAIVKHFLCKYLDIQ